MPKLRNLSGAEVVRILKTFGFEVSVQRGSHLKVRRQVAGFHQSLTIPMHDEIDKGTLKAIHRQAMRFINEQDLRPHFFTD